MSLQNDIKMLLGVWKNQEKRLQHNNTLFNIYEGDLLTYLLEDLQKSLSPQSYEQIKNRVAPINLLKRMIDKLSQLYSKSPQRLVQTLDGKEAGSKDQKLVEAYQKSMGIDTVGSLTNEFFNLFKGTLLEPYLDEGQPKARVVPSDRFFVHSTNMVNPLKPTHLVKIMGTYQAAGKDGGERTVFYAYTKDEFLIFNDREGIETQMMADAYKNGGEYGRNPYGAIPGVYINRSRFELTPKIDTDTLTMTKIIPILLSDVNFAAMFQAFSIVYGIDLDEQNLKMSPNAFWRFKSDPGNPESKPEVGVIKPEADIDKVLSLIHAQLSMWLNSRNIRPGAIGSINTENFQNGISKAIDEMDTCEDRKKQVPYFETAERDFWNLIVNHMHPVWMGQSDFTQRIAFSKGVTVETKFAEQRPMLDTSKQIDDELKLINGRLQSRKGALKALYPDWTEKQIEEKLAEVDSEQPVHDEETGEPAPGEDA